MKRSDERFWLTTYVLPAVVLTATFGALVAVGIWLFDADLDVIWVLISPLLVIAIGYLVDPPRIWVTPVIAVAIIFATALIFGGDAALRFIPAGAILSVIWSAMIWAGKAFRHRRPMEGHGGAGHSLSAR